MRTMNKGKKAAFFALHIILWVGVLAIYIAIIMWLWNWLVPDITGWSDISYLQALGLFALSHLLGGTLFHGGRGKHRFGDKRHKMSREERREFFRRHLSGMSNKQNEDE